MTIHLLKNNFSRGEFTPKAFSRVDLELYSGGAETLNNFISVPHGGIRRRSGTKFIGYPKNNTGNIAFWEFIYSTTGDAYAIEVGENYFRFWQEGGFLVGLSVAITDISKASTAVVTAASHGFNNGDQVTIAGVLGMTEVNNRRFTVANKTTNTFELQGVDSSSYGTYTSSGLATVAYEVPHTYADAEIPAVQFVQVGNAIYIAHQAHAPAKLTRLTGSSWTLADVAFIDGPWNPINSTEVTLTKNTTDADITVGSSYVVDLSNVSAVNDGQGFLAADVGRQLRIKMTKGAADAAPSSTANPPVYAYWASGVITAVASTTQFTWRVDRVLNPVASTNIAGRFKTTGSKSWRLGAFNPTDGYPKCVEVFEGRLVWGNTPANPRTLYFSRSGLPADYAPSDADSTVTADHGFNIDILAGKTDQILWLKDGPRLQLGTSAGIRTIGGNDTGQALSATNLTQRLEVDTGSSSSVVPVAVGNSRLYAGRFGLALHRLFYDYNSNGLLAPNISRLHDHLFTSGISRMTYAQVPDPIVWTLTAGGTVVAIPFDAEEKIIAYCPQNFGGTVKAIASIPGASRDVLFMCVERTLNSTTRRTIEKVEPDFNPLTGTLEDGYFVDCGATYSGPATNVITGLWWLRNEAVAVLADGSVKTNLTVSATGTLTLPGGQTASKVHIGKAFTSEFKTLRPPIQQDDGWLLGRKQRVANAYLEVLRTGDLLIGSDSTNAYVIQNRMGSQPYGTPPNLRGGTYFTKIIDDWRGGQLYGSVSKPHPAFVRSILLQLDTEKANV